MTEQVCNRWHHMLLQLQAQPLPPLPAIAGRVITARDEPLPAEYAVGITSATELALVLHISRQAAYARLQKLRPSTKETA